MGSSTQRECTGLLSWQSEIHTLPLSTISLTAAPEQRTATNGMFWHGGKELLYDKALDRLDLKCCSYISRGEFCPKVSELIMGAVQMATSFKIMYCTWNIATTGADLVSERDENLECWSSGWMVVSPWTDSLIHPTHTLIYSLQF